VEKNFRLSAFGNRENVIKTTNRLDGKGADYSALFLCYSKVQNPHASAFAT